MTNGIEKDIWKIWNKINKKYNELVDEVKRLVGEIVEILHKNYGNRLEALANKYGIPICLGIDEKCADVLDIRPILYLVCKADEESKDVVRDDVRDVFKDVMDVARIKVMFIQDLPYNIKHVYGKKGREVIEKLKKEYRG